MALTPQERGRLGGQATFRKHGRAHMQLIGKRGFAALATFVRGGRGAALGKLFAKGKLVPHRVHQQIELTRQAQLELCQICGLDEVPWPLPPIEGTEPK